MTAAAAGSAFVYLDATGWSNPWIETPLALLFFWLLLFGDPRLWAWTGFFLGLFWFHWIGVSFLHYGHPWAIPFVDLAVAFTYALLFWILARFAEFLTRHIPRLLQKTFNIQHPTSNIHSSYPKAILLWGMSYIHPFGFDWFKPELALVHTPFGIDKAHFAALLPALLFFESFLHSTKLKNPQKSLFSLLLSLLFLWLSLAPAKILVLSDDPEGRIALAGTRIPVEAKWNPDNFLREYRTVLEQIDRAIAAGKKAVLLPESVLPVFLNREPRILDALKRRSQKIDIVLGALYSLRGQNRNSAYWFHRGRYQVADKIVLVPFGEANPLPSWAGRWVNAIFFDGAPDYLPARHPTDFHIDGRAYRAAVCYEGTSERLYADRPARILMMSNNGWFTPSIEATLQRLLLEYYSRKYGTTIYHAVNMGPSYVVVNPKDRKSIFQ